MTEMFGEAWSPMSVPDLAPDDDDDDIIPTRLRPFIWICTGYDIIPTRLRLFIWICTGYDIIPTRLRLFM